MDTNVANGYVKGHSTPLISRETQIKATIKVSPHPYKDGVVRKMRNSRY